MDDFKNLKIAKIRAEIIKNDDEDKKKRNWRRGKEEETKRKKWKNSKDDRAFKGKLEKEEKEKYRCHQ